MPKRPKPILLTVLDGWGFSPERKGNAIALARKPNYDALLEKFPNTLIHTSGPWVGLPEGQMGNSEVGHLNIGAGRIVEMDITRIDRMIATGEFYRHPLLVEAIRRGRENQLHLMGLVSDGGIHSHIEHLFALLRMAAENKAERVFLHCFTDGRDTPPTSGQDYLRLLGQRLREYSVGRIATVAGRYYAMDRDNRWPRIELAYRALAHGEAGAAADVLDEFLSLPGMTLEGAVDRPDDLLRRGDDRCDACAGEGGQIVERPAVEGVGDRHLQAAVVAIEEKDAVLLEKSDRNQFQQLTVAGVGGNRL